MMSRRRRRPLASRVRGFLRAALAFLFSNVGVILLVVGYTIAGAFMFLMIEGAGEMERINNMTRERDNFTLYLWENVTLALNLFNETALKERLSMELLMYQSKIVSAIRHGWEGTRSSRQWSFSSAFLYSLTVITTIGYGHLSPRTRWGKVTTILYALLGMPLFLLYLSNVGSLLARWFKCVYALVCLCRCPGFGRRTLARPTFQLEMSEAESIERPAGWRSRYSDSDGTDFGGRPYHSYTPPHRGLPRRADYLRSLSVPYPPRAPQFPPARGWSEGARQTYPASVSESEMTSEFSFVSFDAQTITVPISVCIGILVGYVMFGSVVFGLWEQWDQLDGAYFCFISLSSIGFGDFVPGERVFSARIETSFIVCSLYLMLGMALVAMCFTLMQEQVIHYFAGMKRALKRICRCKR